MKKIIILFVIFCLLLNIYHMLFAEDEPLSFEHLYVNFINFFKGFGDVGNATVEVGNFLGDVWQFIVDNFLSPHTGPNYDY